MAHIDSLTMELRAGRGRPYLVASEFVVNGRPLLEHIERATGRTFDRVSPFGWTASDNQQEVAERLLLRGPPLLPTGRCELLVCPLCADLSCGCISASISLEGGLCVWSEFGHENDYDPTSLSLFPMGSFTFLKADVVGLLTAYVSGL